MGFQSTTPRRVVLTFEVEATTDWTAAQAAPALGRAGILVGATVRLNTTDAEGNASVDGSVQLRVMQADTALASINPATVPDERLVYDDPAVALTKSATVSTPINIEDLVGDSAVYDVLTHTDGNKRVTVALKGDGTLAGTVVVSLSAKNVT